MEKISYSILNKNVLETFIKAFNLKPVEDKHALLPNEFLNRIETESYASVSISVFDATDEKRGDMVLGINQFMPSYYVFVSCSGLYVEKRVRKEFYVFEYEDVRKVIDEVNNFVKTYIPTT